MEVDQVNTVTPQPEASSGRFIHDAKGAPSMPGQQHVADDSGGREWKPTKRFLLAFVTLQVIVSAVAIEATSLPVALPIMSAELGGSALQAFWVGTSYLLASTVVQPTVASMSNIFGRRMGIGGGGLVVLLEILISDLIPLAHRGTWFSINSAMWSIGVAIGPLVGAGFAQNVSWRWIFWINLPIIGVAILCVTLFLNLAELPGHIARKLMRFDWLGAVLFSVSSTGFLFGITTGGVMFEWSSYAVLVPIIVGFAGLLLFIYWEFRFASEPILEKDIFKTWSATSTYVQTMLHGLITAAVLCFLILYYQAVHGHSPVMSAAALLPETITMGVASVAVGYLTGRTLRYRWALWGGWTLTTLGCGLLYLLQPDTIPIQWIFLNLPVGAGIGVLFTAEILAIQASTEPMLNGHAAAFFSFIRFFGQAAGIAISGVIFQNVLRQKLLEIPEFAPVADQYSKATIVVEVIKQMEAGESKRRIVQAYSDSLQTIWLTLLAFSAISLILSFTVKGYPMTQEHATKQKLVQQEKSAAVHVESAVLGEGEGENEAGAKAEK